MARSTTTSVTTGPRAVVAALCLALLAGLMVWAAPAAHAVGATLDFEDGAVPNGGLVSTQYANAAGITGLSFGGPAALGFTDGFCNGSDLRPTLKALGNGIYSVYAHSGGHIIESPSGGCSSLEFTTGAALMKCSVQCLSVSGWLGSGPGLPYGSDTVRAYDAAGSEIATSVVPIVTTGANNPFTVTAPNGTAIVWVKVQTYGIGQHVWLDDLAYVADPAAVPHFSVVPSVFMPLISLFPGAQATASISISRLNGSTGTLTPSVSGLPVGVIATFHPASFTGASGGTSVMTLTAGAGATPTGVVSLTVSATGPPSAGDATITWTVPLHFDATITRAQPLATPAAPDCTAQVRNVSVDVRPGYTGFIDFSVAVTEPNGLPPADPTRWAVQIAGPSHVQVSGGRAAAVVEWLRRPSADPWVWLVVSASVPGQPADSFVAKTKLTRIGPGLTNGPLVAAHAPLGDRQAGNTVSTEGWGFCPGTSLVFGNDKAVAPATVTQPSLAVSPLGYLNGQTLTATTPRLATSGKLSALDQDSVRVVGPPLASSGYRNTAGLSFHNYSVNDLTYQDMTDAFGEDQMYLHIDLCYPAGCTVTVRDPIAMVYTAIVRSWAVGTSGSGHCYGMALTAAQLRHGHLAETSYPPYWSTTAYGLTGPSGPSAALARTIQANHLKQFGFTFIGYWLHERYGHFARSHNDFITQVRDAIDHHGGALIAMAQGGSGHVVVATSVEEVSQWEQYIDVYDPNREYTTGEDTDTTGTTHQSMLDGSRIHLTSNKWSFDVSDTAHWFGQIGGIQEQIVVVPLDEASKRQAIPNMFDISSLTSLVDGVIGFGSTGGAPPKATPGAGVLAYPTDAWGVGGGIFVAPSGRGDVALTGRGTGTLSGMSFSRGTVTTLSMPTAQGRRATAGLVPGGMAVVPASTTPVTLQSSRRVRASTVTTSVTATTAAGGRAALSSDAAGVRFSGAGKMRLKVTTTSPHAVPFTRTARITLAKGETLALPMTTLTSHRASLRVRVTGRGVTVSKVLTARVLLVGTASITRVTAVRAKGSVRVKVAANARSKVRGATASITFTVLQGRTVVSRLVRKVVISTRANPRTYRATLRLPKHGRYRVRTSLALLPRSGATGAVMVQRSVRSARP